MNQYYNTYFINQNIHNSKNKLQKQLKNDQTNNDIKKCKFCSSNNKNKKQKSNSNKYKQKYDNISKQRSQNSFTSKFSHKSQQIKQNNSLKFNRQIKEENKYLASQSSNICEYQLSHCKFIKSYLKQINNHLKQQKKQKQILKRRNQQLVRQNKILNQYFKIFQAQYSQEKVNLQQSKTSSDSLRYSKSMTKHDGLFFSFKNQNIISPSNIKKGLKNSQSNLKQSITYQLNINQPIRILSPGLKSLKHSSSLDQSENSLYPNKYSIKSSRKRQPSTFYLSKLYD